MRLPFIPPIAFLAVIGFLSCFAPGAIAHDYRKGSLFIDHPWSRATPRGAKVAAGYLAIENRGKTADRLISVSSGIAGRVEIHEMKTEQGVARMRPLARGLALEPGVAAKLEPGGFHLMFHDLKRALAQGQRFKATLTFEKAGTIEVEFAVEAMGGPGGHHRH